MYHTQSMKSTIHMLKHFADSLTILVISFYKYFFQKFKFTLEKYIVIEV